MADLTISQIASKVSELLWKGGRKGTIAFDHNSYENPSDIPSLNIGGTRYPVHIARVSQNGSTITVTVLRKGLPNPWKEYVIRTGWDPKFSAGLAPDKVQYERLLVEQMGVYDLLSDIYYETDESWEIGDFEEDFLKS